MGDLGGAAGRESRSGQSVSSVAQEAQRGLASAYLRATLRPSSPLTAVSRSRFLKVAKTGSKSPRMLQLPFWHQAGHTLHRQQVFKIEVLMNGRKHFVEKRYSEFHALHKKLKKCIKTPEIPSKHVRNWVPKVLEQRRQGLETYLQGNVTDEEKVAEHRLVSFCRAFAANKCWGVGEQKPEHREGSARWEASMSEDPDAAAHLLRVMFLKEYLAVILENEELPKLFLDFLNVRHLPSLPKAESCGSFDETESEESSKLSHQPVLLFLRDPYVLPAAGDFPNVVIEGVLHGIFYPHLQP
ncbi:hypothetical protein GH733_009522, partial [Mirounga leonina]